MAEESKPQNAEKQVEDLELNKETIQDLTEQMRNAAAELQFEVAARLRDEISELKKELRQFDTKAFPDIVPILADVLRTDAKASVRLEAAQSLARIRPVSQGRRSHAEARPRAQRR